jgi:acyl transferase domain-containing protein
MTGSCDIAVVGLAGRFPGARTPSELWRNIRDGVESITFFNDDELLAAGVERSLLRDPNYVKAGAVLPDMEMFDAGFFGFSPNDAAIMDPQHRHFLECAWEALESAGHRPESFAGSIGVYAGSGMNGYLMFNLVTNPRLMENVGLFLLRHTGNDKDFLTTRVSYALNLNGPSVNVQTACSTSLVAIHLACQSLLNGECDMALAGGVTIEIPHRRGYLYREGEILSRDGHCRVFDASSTGTVFGSGVGVVVLRRVEEAVRDGDTIHALIKGSAINNDGSLKVGYLAPSVDGQAAVISESIRMAGVEINSISYVEAHGTGTAVGDPIEIEALTQAFRQGTTRNQFCAIGSLKSNIGHLDTAAGVASFIKTVLALQHKQLPPSLHFEKSNPLIAFDSSPFYVNSHAQPWPRGATPRRAGVSSLGVGGTNAHVILEEPPEVLPAASSRPRQLLVVSARSEQALQRARTNLGDFLAENALEIADVAFTLQEGRKAFEWRGMVVCRDASDAARAFSDPKRFAFAKSGSAEPRIAFLFPGGGAQHPNMGVDLYKHEPVYRTEVDRAAEFVRTKWGLDFLRSMFPAASDVPEAVRQLEKPSLALPALFACEYALARLWQNWVGEADSMIGHSLGEYVAACLAGVMSLEEALSLVVVRGRLFETLAEGAMLSVPLSEDELKPRLSAGLSIAAINAPQLCVASGDSASIAALQDSLAEQGLDCKRVRISVAAHSAMVEAILEQFGEYVSTLRLQAPRIPYVSNVTGTWITASQAQDPRYWVEHLRHTVRFSDGLRLLLESRDRILVEVGPGQVLTSLARLHGGTSPGRALASLPHAQDSVPAQETALRALGRLWLAGKKIDWKALHEPEPRRRVPLPTYPFEHRRYWIEAGKPTGAVVAPESSAALTACDDLTNWFYRPVWKKSAMPVSREDPGSSWLIFTDSQGLGARLRETLAASGRQVTTVEAGERFAQLSPESYSVDAAGPEDHIRLVQEIKSRGRFPNRIAHLWTATAKEPPERMLELGFYSLLFFAQALVREDVRETLRLGIISTHMQRLGVERVHPEKAAILGPCRVIANEFPNIRCRSIDIDSIQENVAADLIGELTCDDTGDTVVAYRQGERWRQELEAFPVGPVRREGDALRQAGVYLITGGYGGLGLKVAEYLAGTFHARLVLVGRNGVPDRSQWARLLKRRDAVAARIEAVEGLERIGSEVLALSGDVCDAAQMRAVIETAHARFGAIHGIIHAAGVLDDGPIALKTRETVDSVLAPKVRGTLVLESLLRKSRPDFLALFSSTSSMLGLPGQVDYTASNAFLNAYAESRSDDPHTRVIAINWGTWREVGMAAAAAGKGNGSALRHPLLGKRREDNQHRAVYSARYSPKTHWILEEHKIRDRWCVLPGTGYLEIARAALEPEGARSAVGIDELLLFAPLAIPSKENREVRVTVDDAAGGGSTISIASRSSEEDGWHENARAKVTSLNAPAPARIEIGEVAARCGLCEINCGPDWRSNQERHLTFGPRWKCLRRIRFGAREALAELELGGDFAADLESFAVHPALLDQAAGFALPLIDGYEALGDLYVPMSYQKVRIWRPLPRRVLSHARYKGTNMGMVTFDVTVMDSRGEVLVEMNEFAMRRIDSGASFGASGQTSPQAAGETPSLLDELLENGIPQQQGVEAFHRILAHSCVPQIVVSPVPPATLEQRIRFRNQAPSERRRTATARSRVAPRTPIEAELADMWSQVLGCETVSVEDNWFELGGHSLLAIRILSRLRQKFRVELSPDLFFEFATLAAQAQAVEKALAQAHADDSVRLIPLAREQFRRKRQELG